MLSLSDPELSNLLNSKVDVKQVYDCLYNLVCNLHLLIPIVKKQESSIVNNKYSNKVLESAISSILRDIIEFKGLVSPLQDVLTRILLYSIEKEDMSQIE